MVVVKAWCNAFCSQYKKVRLYAKSGLFYKRISIGREFSNLHLKNIVIEVFFRIISIFTTSYRHHAGSEWFEGETYIWKAFTWRLVFFASNFATLIQVEDKATVDAYGICIDRYRVSIRLHDILYTISAWASALLILLDRQCEGLKRGISDRYSSHAFFVYAIMGLIYG